MYNALKCWQGTKGAEDPSCQKMLQMNLVEAHSVFGLPFPLSYSKEIHSVVLV